MKNSIISKYKKHIHPAPPVSPPDETIYNNGSNYFEHFIKDIDAAQTHIHIEIYIFQKDILGNRIVQSLIAAAQRRVKIYIIVDGCGTPYWGTQYAKTLEKAGIKTKIHHPFPWQFWNWSRSVVKLPVLIKWMYFFLKANKRNHRKVFIIDKKIAYVGSFNITKDHLSNHEGGGNWRDTGIRLANTDLSQLLEAFDCVWTHRTIKERIHDAFRIIRRDPIIRLNNTRHRRRLLYKNLLARMRQCKQRIWITNAYFVPDNFLLKQLKEAAQRGIDVRILLPSKVDTLIPIAWTATIFYQSLLKAGVRIYEYLPNILHAKSLIIDNWVLVGSTNLDNRSLIHNLEIDVRLSNQSTKQKVEEMFLEDLEQAQELCLTSLKKHRPFYKIWLGRLFLYLKYWI